MEGHSFRNRRNVVPGRNNDGTRVRCRRLVLAALAPGRVTRSDRGSVRDKGMSRILFLLCCGVLLSSVWLGPAVGQTHSPRWKCPSKPIEPCVMRHGRLSSQNGIGLKLWAIGTKRMFAIENGSENLPPVVRKYLEMTSPDHSYIFGDFEVCPVEPDRPGHIRAACLASGVNLVVQPLRDARLPFRLLSTWSRPKL